MKVATYGGCKIRVRAGRGADWGRMFATLNGEPISTVEKFDEVKAIAEITRDLAVIHAAPIDGDSNPAHYYAPGTYALCEYGHPVTPGEACLHTYCQREGR